ncbi:MAG TPA: hypothetical protein VFO84_08685 [Dehalococcoidia bacterium]|nr:hypothetical protein [Dehalococcoidia bacterium]
MIKSARPRARTTIPSDEPLNAGFLAGSAVLLVLIIATRLLPVVA